MDPVIIYDGWPLTYEKFNPAALHIDTLLAYHPEDIQGCLLLPGEPGYHIPDHITVEILPTENSDLNRLRWEQHTLPKYSRSFKTPKIHTTSGGLPLINSIPTLYSPCIYSNRQHRNSTEHLQSFFDRVRISFAQGAQSRLSGILWPKDIPKKESDEAIVYAPPIVHPVFHGVGEFKIQTHETGMVILPDAYILYNGSPAVEGMRDLLTAWSWASGVIGSEYPLVIICPTQAEKERISTEVHASGLQETVILLTPESIYEYAQIVKSASVLIHLGPITPWSNPVRSAMACSVPVIAMENQTTDQIAGPGAYLVPQASTRKETLRATSAGIITIVIELDLAESIATSASARASEWKVDVFRKTLREIYLR